MENGLAQHMFSIDIVECILEVYQKQVQFISHVGVINEGVQTHYKRFRSASYSNSQLYCLEVSTNLVDESRYEDLTAKPTKDFTNRYWSEVFRGLVFFV